MEYEELRKWLDLQVESLENQRSIVSFNNQIKTINAPSYIHISRGIELVADIMGLELVHEAEYDKEFPHRYICTYRDVPFIQLSKSPLSEPGKEV